MFRILLFIGICLFGIVHLPTCHSFHHSPSDFHFVSSRVPTGTFVYEVPLQVKGLTLVLTTFTLVHESYGDSYNHYELPSLEPTLESGVIDEDEVWNQIRTFAIAQPWKLLDTHSTTRQLCEIFMSQWISNSEIMDSVDISDHADHRLKQVYRVTHLFKYYESYVYQETGLYWAEFYYKDDIKVPSVAETILSSFKK